MHGTMNIKYYHMFGLQSVKCEDKILKATPMCN